MIPYSSKIILSCIFTKIITTIQVIKEFFKFLSIFRPIFSNFVPLYPKTQTFDQNFIINRFDLLSGVSLTTSDSFQILFIL